MRLLVIGDIHAELSFLSRILFQAAGFGIDGIVLVGDIGDEVLATRDSDRQELRRKYYQGTVEAVFVLLERAELPVYYVHGNRDMPEISNNRENFHNIDILSGGKHIEVGDYYLLGIGGSNYEPSEALLPERPKWYNEWTEQEADDAAMAYINENGANIKMERLILVSHDAPWYTALDRGQHGGPLGSQTIRHLASAWEPSILLCGHIHESAGVDLLGRRTLALNAGSIFMPDVTFIGVEPPRFTNLSVVYAEHFYILDLDPKFPSPRAEHYESKQMGNQKGLFTNVYTVQKGKLLMETEHGQIPHPCTGNKPFPTKSELYERMKELRNPRRFIHTSPFSSKNSSSPLDRLIKIKKS